MHIIPPANQLSVYNLAELSQALKDYQQPINKTIMRCAINWGRYYRRATVNSANLFPNPMAAMAWWIHHLTLQPRPETNSKQPTFTMMARYLTSEQNIRYAAHDDAKFKPTVFAKYYHVQNRPDLTPPFTETIYLQCNSRHLCYLEHTRQEVTTPAEADAMEKLHQQWADRHPLAEPYYRNQADQYIADIITFDYGDRIPCG